MPILSTLLQAARRLPGRRWRRTWAVAQLAAALMVLQPALARGVDVDFNEYHLKAAFLYNFAKFVDWPAPAPGEAEGPFTICILGAEAFVSARETLAGKSVKGRPVEVRRVDRVEAARQCHLLFVSAPEGSPPGPAVGSLGSHVLTVGEADDFVRSGGLINLRKVDNKVRFEIARSAGEQAGFKFRVQLLQRAIEVDRAR